MRDAGSPHRCRRITRRRSWRNGARLRGSRIANDNHDAHVINMLPIFSLAKCPRLRASNVQSKHAETSNISLLSGDLVPFMVFPVMRAARFFVSPESCVTTYSIRSKASSIISLICSIFRRSVTNNCLLYAVSSVRISTISS